MVNSPDNFVPRPSVSTDKAAEESRPPQKPSRIWQFANKFGLAAFLTSVAVSPIIATGNAEQLVHDPAGAVVSTVDDLGSAAVGVVKSEFKAPVPGSEATETVRKLLAAQGVNFGDPIMVTDPNTGEKRIEQKQGSIGKISTKGTVGTGVVEEQGPVYRYGASMSDKEASPEDLQGIDLDNLELTVRIGGPDFIDTTGGTPKPANWDSFSAKNGKTVFVAEKFVTYKDSAPVVSNSGGGVVPLPSTPAGK